MIHAFIVEDEPLAVERLCEFVAREDDIAIVGVSASGADAVAEINRLAPDLLFLDIHLSDMSGLDMLRLLEQPPVVIFTTAYDQYALDAFDLNAVDYLLKPYDYPRFRKAVDKARKLLAAAGEQKQDTAEQIRQLLNNWHPTAGYLTRIPSKRGDKIRILSDDDIIYFSSENKLVFAFEYDAKHLLNYTLDALQNRLDPDKFFRIHRSTIVNLNYVKTIESWFKGGYRLTVKDKSGTQLTISRAAGKLLRQTLDW